MLFRVQKLTILRWSTETPPSWTKEDSVLLSSEAPSRYVLSET
jgi:hypothetical protein